MGSAPGTRIRRRWRAAPRWVRWPILVGIGLGSAGVAALGVLWLTVDLPDDPPTLQSSVVVAADGREVAVLSQDGRRFEVPLSEVSPLVIDALIAAEDRRFYDHSGVDPIGVARALWHNVRRDGTQGGSTITQQLVKNEFLSSERTLWRKAREAVLSVKLERSEDKDRILERYLNTVYFGRGAYGIEAAARGYFDTTASELTLDQAALLVGLLRSPETADPTEDPDEAMARRAVVLQDLVETASITQDEADAADASLIEASPRTSPITLSAGLAPHFVEWVREQTIAAVGEDALYGAGLRVVTTLDLDAQAAAEAAVADTLSELDDPQAALVALDTDGSIRAHVGGRDFEALQVDLVRGEDGGGSGRQPGSSFKPFVLQAAMERGVTLGDRYAAPPTIDLEVGGTPWTVGNYGGAGYGDLSVADATADSVNTVYAQLLAEVGPQAVADAAAAAGIDAELDVVPSIALGVEEVSPLDLASAYLTFANDGERLEPYAVTRIEDADGDVLWEPERSGPSRAIEPDVSRAVTHALRGAVEGGTGTAADIGRTVAGKTGTTQDNVDAWFAGYVPGYATVVWMGYPEASRPMDDVRGRAVTGGSLPAQIWSAYMASAMEGREAAEFPPPPDELLEEGQPANLTLNPAEAEPGSAVNVQGSGFGVCRASWSVAVVGTAVSSPPETGSSEDARSAAITVPDDLDPGTYRVVARCDSGAGERDAATADLVVLAPAGSTTSTSTSVPEATSSTSDPGEPPTTSTTTAPTTTSTVGALPSGSDP